MKNIDTKNCFIQTKIRNKTIKRARICRHPILSGIFQIHFSQIRFHFRAKDFSFFYEILGLKLQKKKRRKSIPGQIQKLIFLYSVNLVEFIVKNKNWISEIENDVN